MVAPHAAADVVTPAYDALTSDDRRRARRRSPLTFLHALPTETAPGGVTAADLDHCAAAVDRLSRDVFRPVPAPFVAVYRLREADHVQTGLVADLDLRALRDDVRGHEHTRHDREDDLVRYLRRVGVQSSPVCLATPRAPDLAAALATAATGPATVTVADDDLVQELWVVTAPDAVAGLLAAAARVPDAVITDGHHRAAAAHRFAGDHGRGPAAQRLMVALFAAQDLRVAAFHRVVSGRLPMHPADVAAALRSRGLTVRPAGPDALPVPGVPLLLAAGRWWHVELPPQAVPTPDVARLQAQVLAPVLGVADPRGDDRLRYVPASVPTGVFVRTVGRDGVGFLVTAPSAADLLAAARARQVLPPKSTYVHPKARSGLLLVARA